jgi:hypothetical protein
MTIIAAPARKHETPRTMRVLRADVALSDDEAEDLDGERDMLWICGSLFAVGAQSL